jgi:hypothetical protein
MAWARIDDSRKDHPKIVAAGPIPELIQIRALQYSNRYLTDGFIPSAVVPSLLTGFETIAIVDGGIHGIGAGRADGIDWPAHMIRWRLWENAKGGYRVHNFLKWNISKAGVLAKREAKQKAGVIGAKVTNSRRYGPARAAVSAAPPAAASAEGASLAPLPLPIPKNNPGTTDGGNSIRERGVAVRGEGSNVSLSQHSKQLSRRQPSGANPTRINESPILRDTRSPRPLGTFDEIQRRLTAEEPNKSREEIERLAMTEYMRAMEARPMRPAEILPPALAASLDGSSPLAQTDEGGTNDAN